MKEKKTVSELLDAEQKKLEKLEAKKTDIESKMKACKENIQKYKLLDNTEKLKQLTDSLGDKGISINEIMSAVKSGDFTALQDKIENAD